LTGCGGFLGYYFSLVFAKWNMNNENVIETTLQDNFMRGVPDWINVIKDIKGITIEKHDVLDGYEHFNFHNVIHAASIASPIFYRKNPIETMDANVIGLRNLLDLQLAFQKTSSVDTNFLFFSTSEIYGDPPPEEIPTSEEYRGNVSCTGPRACYDESKRFGETLCVNYTNQYNLRTVIVRPFNNFGPGLKLDDGRVIPDFCSSALKENKIKMFSDGSPKRTFCYISDAITGYIKALVNGKKGKSYNIGTEKPEISMLNLAENISELMNELFQTNCEIQYEKSQDTEYLTDNPDRRCPNISLAKKDLGYDPVVDLKTGLRNSLIWYSENK
jgi:nucleoside-diphosphate-sugar epimerase